MTKQERLKDAEELADKHYGNTPGDRCKNIFKHGYLKGAEAEAESKWVYCSYNNYPNENEEVIVYFEYKFEGREIETGVTSAIYETQNTLRHCFYQHNGSVVVGVVKWQPMPKS